MSVALWLKNYGTLKYIYFQLIAHLPIPVVELSKAWVYSRFITGIAGLSPAAGTVCIL